MTENITPATVLVTSSLADDDLVQMLRTVFGDYRAGRATPTEVVDLDDKLWAHLDELGLTRLLASEKSGGSGAGWLEAGALLGLAAGAAAPVPLLEHDVLAAWLLETAGLPHDGGLRTACVPDTTGRATAVPWVPADGHVVALWHNGDKDTDANGGAAADAGTDSGGQWRVADVDVDLLTVTAGRDLAGFPSATVLFPIELLRAGAPVDDSTLDRLVLRETLGRCAQICGGFDRTLEVVLTHTQERQQFGRPIARFQDVQHLVVDLATEAALARAATDTALAKAAADEDDPSLPFAVAVAASCVGHAASVVVRNAHQALGAIGTTLEHELHLLTKPVLVRRSAVRSVHQWDVEVSRLSVAAGREGLWSLVTTGIAPVP